MTADAIHSCDMNLLFALALAAAPQVEDTVSLYRVLMLRAAPGRLLEVIDLVKQAASHPYIMRHSQGDQWDLLLVLPAEHDRVTPAFEPRLEAELGARIAWREEVFVNGPAPDRVRAWLTSGDFYHIEMHIAVAGKQADLRKEREMENAYEHALGRPEDLIFRRVAGAAWDVVTIGTFHDIKHYAESADISPARQDSAARVAGYASADAIGPYLRTLISSHHDTLARAVR